MIKKIFFVSLFWASQIAYATPPGDFVQKSLIGGSAQLSFSGGEAHVWTIKNATLDCTTLVLFGDRGEVSIPAMAVDTVNYQTGVMGFACINGGGCVAETRSPGINEMTIHNLGSSGVKESIIKAFKLHQKACGGPVKRPY